MCGYTRLMKAENEEMEIYRYTLSVRHWNQASALEAPSNILE